MAAGGEFFSLPFQKDQDFCDFFSFQLSQQAELSRPTVTALLYGSAKISIENKYLQLTFKKIYDIM